MLERLVEENQKLLRKASHDGSDVMPFLERHQQLMVEIKELEVFQEKERVAGGSHP